MDFTGMEGISDLWDQLTLVISGGPTPYRGAAMREATWSIELGTDGDTSCI